MRDAVSSGCQSLGFGNTEMVLRVEVVLAVVGTLASRGKGMRMQCH